MAKIDYPPAVQNLIRQLRRLPGVGPRSAERMAVWLLRHGGECFGALSEALIETQSRIAPCAECGFYVQDEVCLVCDNGHRDSTQLCVVEQAADILSIERTGAFKGLYHTLGGRLSPLEHVGPGDLRISELLGRIRRGGVQEVILALSADVEGESTSSYLAERLQEFELSVTRIAHGLPVGGGLEYVDDLTLQHAFSGRAPLRRAVVYPKDDVGKSGG